MSIFVSCGEPSGDIYAGKIIGEILRKDSRIRIEGMLGPQGALAGGFARWDISELGLLGISEVLSSIPRLLRLRAKMVRFILREGFPLLVLIDSPDFHLPLLRSLKANGFKGKIVYVAPPTVWAWRPGRTRELAENTDLCLPLFSFEDDFLKSKGVNSRWLGHPFLDEPPSSKVSRELHQKFSGSRVAGLLPGSRRSEIKNLLPLFFDLAVELEQQGFQPVFSVAPGLSEDVRKFLLAGIGKFPYYEGPGRELISISSVTAAASGTVAVESMMLDRFMVVSYRGSLASYLAYRFFVKTSYISIPNILAGREVYPELLQKDVTVRNILTSLIRYRDDQDYRKAIHKLLAEGRSSMGRAGVIAFWASTIREMLN